MSPNVNDLSNSNFVAKKDVDPPILVTIQSYEEINVAREGVEPDIQWALRFRELEKPFILKPTNGNIIAAITGSEDFNEWIGWQIVLWIDPTVSFGPKLVGGVRVRASQRPQPTAHVPAEPDTPTYPGPEIIEPSTEGSPIGQPPTGDDIPF